ETCALLVKDPVQSAEKLPLHRLIHECQEIFGSSDRDSKQRYLIKLWTKLEKIERLALNKLLLGTLRFGVGRKLLAAALARVHQADETTIAHRLADKVLPTVDFYESLAK